MGFAFHRFTIGLLGRPWAADELRELEVLATARYGALVTLRDRLVQGALELCCPTDAPFALAYIVGVVGFERFGAITREILPIPYDELRRRLAPAQP
jgi:hypothetical protein